jgi:hypothetical protein
MNRGSQLSAYVLIPALLLGVLTACWSSSSAWAVSGSSGEPGSSSVSIVSCSGNSCSVTLSGNSLVRVLDTTFSVERIEDGRATLRVADREVSCSAGQSVSVGSLNLTCTRVTSDTVTFTASRA